VRSRILIGVPQPSQRAFGLAAHEGSTGQTVFELGGKLVVGCTYVFPAEWSGYRLSGIRSRARSDSSLRK
jgi:hypothetical protein